jgi:hypothetical protein
MSQGIAGSALRSPDYTEKGKQPGTTVYVKEYVKDRQSHTIQLITTKNERGEVIVISTWVDPPFAGSVDVQKQKDWKAYKKASFWGKVWYTLKRQVKG